MARELERAVRYAQSTFASLKTGVPCPNCVDRILFQDEVASRRIGLLAHRELLRSMVGGSLLRCPDNTTHQFQAETCLYHFNRRHPTSQDLSDRSLPDRHVLSAAAMELSVFLYVTGIATIAGTPGEGAITGKADGRGIDKKTWYAKLPLKQPFGGKALDAFCSHLCAEFPVVAAIAREGGILVRSSRADPCRAVFLASKLARREPAKFLQKWRALTPHSELTSHADWQNECYRSHDAYRFVRHFVASAPD